MHKDQQKPPRRDLFAEIAARPTSDPQPRATRGEALVAPSPPRLPDATLPLDATPMAIVKPRPRRETEAALQEELAR